MKVLTFFFEGVEKKENINKSESNIPNKTKNNHNVNEVINPVKKILSSHKPYKNSECRRCHDTRSSAMLTENKNSICFNCHNILKFQGRYVHGPIASGQCSTCHLPHESEYTSLLRTDQAELCFFCHTKNIIQKIKDHEEYTSCLRCHLPHTSENNYFLRGQVK